MPYLVAFLVSLFAVVLLTPLVRAVALRLRIVDIPGEPRKIHKTPTPLLGGLAIMIGLMLVMWSVALFTPYLLNSTIKFKHLFGVTLGALVLALGGVLDERYNLKPSRQIIFPIIAALTIIASGIGITQITNPFGGVFSLAQWQRVLFWQQGIPYTLTLPADLFTFIWLMALMYTTKLLDGLDGLVSGITVIGALMIFFLATATKYFQPEVGMLAIVVAGVFLGFLKWNWHPAKIFLGTSGSTLAGFLLGTLAIISGGKIATALLVLGIPVLDMVWVILQRAVLERRWPTLPDRKHLHFRLLGAGFSHQGAVLLFLAIAAGFGLTTLFLQSQEKLVALGMLGLVMALLGGWVIFRARKTLKLGPRL